jgi:hypothetical protein
MPHYNVHIHREVRLTYESIEADTAHAATAIALDRSVGAADDIDDCDGEAFAALVDVAGDDQYEKTVTIDFEAERMRKAAPRLIDVMLKLLPLFCDMLDDLEDSDESGSHPLVVASRAIITEATNRDAQRRPL